jgi:hypothetical protein
MTHTYEMRKDCLWLLLFGKPVIEMLAGSTDCFVYYCICLTGVLSKL